MCEREEGGRRERWREKDRKQHAGRSIKVQMVLVNW